jgi:hypothetical protein
MGHGVKNDHLPRQARDTRQDTDDDVRKSFVPSTFPMFVPSLSWQNDHFLV